MKKYWTKGKGQNIIKDLSTPTPDYYEIVYISVNKEPWNYMIHRGQLLKESFHWHIVKY